MIVEQALLLLSEQKIPKSSPDCLRSFYLRRFSPPRFPIIHVAGTNGKGSVSEKLRYGYENAGYKTGFFTSPHLSTFRERIQVGGNIIDEFAFADVYQTIQKETDKESISLSFFATLVLMALQYFSRKQVDIAIIEVGLGGRFDPTNLFSPLLSIITQVDYDHMNVLGEDIEQIAHEKAGIIKPNVPVVLGPNAHFSSIFAEAADKKSPVLFTPNHPVFWYDEENTLIAKTALEYLGINSEGIEHVRPPCRFEEVEPGVIFDVAHNEPGFEALFSALKLRFPQQNFRFFLSLAKGKKIPSSFPKESFVHFASDEHPRLASIVEMKKCLVLSTPHAFCPTFTDGFLHAFSLASERKEVFVVAGSFYMMDKAKKLLKNVFTKSALLSTKTGSGSFFD